MKTNYKLNPRKILGYLMACAIVLFSMNANAHVLTPSYGSATANATGVVTISTCNYLSEYATISGIDSAISYTCDIQMSGSSVGYVTIYEGSVSGTLVSHGYAPHTWTSNSAGTYYAHWTLDDSCVTASGCHTTSIAGNAPVVAGCTDPLATNFNPLANSDDGSCTYAGCVSGIEQIQRVLRIRLLDYIVKVHGLSGHMMLQQVHLQVLMVGEKII